MILIYFGTIVIASAFTFTSGRYLYEVFFGSLRSIIKTKKSKRVPNIAKKKIAIRSISNFKLSRTILFSWTNK